MATTTILTAPPTSNVEVKDIPLEHLYADDEWNCRGRINALDVIDLSRNMEAKGLQQPILVQPWDGEAGKKFRVIAGYRRVKAAEVLRWPTIPCIIKYGLTEIDARLLNLGENVNRKELNILQEAKAIAGLVSAGLTQNEVSERINMSRGWVQVRFYLLTLPAEIQAEAAAGNLNYQQIRDLNTIGNREQQFEAIRKIKEAKLKGEKPARPVKQPNRNPHRKERRERPEIFAMMDHMQSTIGNGLHTRALAWAAGEITDHDLFQSLKAACEAGGIDYIIPTEGLLPVTV